MKNLTFKRGMVAYSFNIDTIKYCIGSNYKEKYKFKQIILEYVNNYKVTEYSLEHSGQAKLFFNNKEMNNKNISFYYVDHKYSIQEDLKLSSKSLIAKYLESLLSNNENIDTINSINILLEAFGNELDNEIIVTRFMTYTPKLFLKIILPIFCLSSEQANEYDLDYNEIIILQLKMIDYISRMNEKDFIFCVLDIPILTKEIKEFMDTLNNVLLIVFINSFSVIPLMDDIYIFDRIIIDLNNEEELYNVFTHRGICTLEEAKAEMKQLLNKQKEKLDWSIFNKI